MIKNKVKVRVKATAEDLWDNFLEPEMLESTIPTLTKVEKLCGGVYLVRMEVKGMEYTAKMKEERVERPRIAEIKSSDPYFHLKTVLEEVGDGVTDVAIMVRLDPPSFFGMLDDKIKEEVEERMEESVHDMKKKIEGGE